MILTVFLLWDKWELTQSVDENGNVITQTQLVTNNSSTEITDVPLPSDVPTAELQVSEDSTPAIYEPSNSGAYTTVVTDLLTLQISHKGGTIISALLNAYPESLNSEERFELLSNSPDRIFHAQSGLIPADQMPTHQDEYTSEREEYFLIGFDISEYKVARANVDRRFVVPSASAPDYEARISSIIREQKPALIIPTNDPEVEKLSEIRERLDTQLFFPDHESVALCLNKWNFYNFAVENEIRMAETYHVENLDDVDDIFSRFSSDLLWCRAIKGAGSKGATKVKDAEQARWWIKYWNEMRGMQISDFTISEFLPGRDFACQSTWKNGKLILMKAAERLSYIEAASRPSNMSSSPELAKTVYDKELFDFCIDVIGKLSGGQAHGNYDVDIKMNSRNEYCVTEINIGRFFMITNLFNLSGKYSMIDTYLKLATGEDPEIDDPFDFSEKYLIRSLDTLPTVLSPDEITRRLQD